MGTNRTVEQEREDQRQVAFSEYVSFPERPGAERATRKSFEQVIDQAFEQAARMDKGRQGFAHIPGADQASSVLSHVPGLRLMGL